MRIYLWSMQIQFSRNWCLSHMFEIREKLPPSTPLTLTLGFWKLWEMWLDNYRPPSKTHYFMPLEGIHFCSHAGLWDFSNQRLSVCAGEQITRGKKLKVFALSKKKKKNGSKTGKWKPSCNHSLQVAHCCLPLPFLSACKIERKCAKIRAEI